MFQRVCTPALATCSSGCLGLGLQKNTAYTFLPSFPKNMCKGGVKINRLITASNKAQSGPEKTIDLLENYVDEGRGPELESDDAEHPSVAQVMNRSVVSLRDTMKLRDAIQIFLGRGISGAPVVDAAGHLVGVLSETDIILRETGIENDSSDRKLPFHFLPMLEGANAALNGFDKHKMHDLLELSVGDVMSADPVTASPDQLVMEAAATMVNSRVNRLPVVNKEGRVLGIITRGDIMQCMVWEILVLGDEEGEKKKKRGY